MTGFASLDDALRASADEPMLEMHREELGRLAGAAATPNGLSAWASTDLLAAFSRSDLLTDDVDDRHHRIVLALQSVLVFVPVIITWFGLVLATSAYGTLLAAPDAAVRVRGRSFLQLWVEGFDGELAAPLRFSFVGAYTLAVLGVLVVLTLWSSYRSRRRGDARESKRREVLARLVPALLQAQRGAAASSLASPARFAAELSSAAAGLGRVVDRMLTAQSDLVAQGAAARDLTSTLEAASARVGEAVDGLSTAAGRSQAASEAGRTAMLSVEQTLSEHARSVTEAATGLGGAASTVERVCLRLEEAGPTLSRSLTTAGTDAAGEIGAVYGQALTASLTELRDQVKVIASDLGEATEDFRAVAEQLADRAHGDADRHSRAVTELAEATAALRRSLETRTDAEPAAPSDTAGDAP